MPREPEYNETIYEGDSITVDTGYGVAELTVTGVSQFWVKYEVEQGAGSFGMSADKERMRKYKLAFNHITHVRSD